MSNLLGPLGVTSTFPFVGRSAELERLRLLMPRAAGEGGRAVLIGGEAGSGKSRLVREFAAGAARDGALVLHGACDAVVHTPYGPFVEALGQLTRAVGPTSCAWDGASSRGSCPSWRPAPPRVHARPTPTPTRSATGSTRRSPTCSRA